MACKPCPPSSLLRPLSPASLIVLFGSAGCISLSLPTRLCHTWPGLRRLHRAIAITNTTRLNAVLSRTRRTLVHHGLLCCLARNTLVRTLLDLTGEGV